MGMSVCEKILYAHALGLKEKKLEPGQVVCLAPDWILCSEASWGHMDKLYTQYGRPGFKRGDRFWLAPDHLVDPRINHLPRQRAMIEACENIATELDMKDNYNPPNTTIVHTEFYRSRCQPGMLIFGQDSHTGSSGCLGAVAIGMGAKDIFVQCLTGETYLKIPEVVNIRIVGKPKFGVTGKDVILGILKAIKRNTMCLERLVEFTGPGLEYLSCDARFTMCNMVTELGGIGSCVVADAVTKAYLEQRKDPRHKRNALYYQPDADAKYTDSCEIDLSTIETFVALFPSPDNVKPISEADRFALDGVFIGACTTSEEELILAALVLEQGLLEGRTPVTKGLRRVTPGSKAIVDRLNALGLLDFYERAGFVIGAPGCSYCVGLGADQAGKGEVWLSSQNRNFRDRMGPGALNCSPNIDSRIVCQYYFCRCCCCFELRDEGHRSAPSSGKG
jgi:homoaconitate hydratase